MQRSGGGALYAFTNRPRTLLRMLWFDGTGLCMFSKRLERARDAVGHRSEAVERGYFAADDAAKAKVMAALNDAVMSAERDGMEGCNEGSKFAVSRQ